MTPLDVGVAEFGPAFGACVGGVGLPSLLRKKLEETELKKPYPLAVAPLPRGWPVYLGVSGDIYVDDAVGSGGRPEVIRRRSWLGDSAIYFALKDSKRVFAIEPHHSAFAEMLENIRLKQA
jgi:hypothetical protein